jgi:hypothetical protein
MIDLQHRCDLCAAGGTYRHAHELSRSGSRKQVRQMAKHTAKWKSRPSGADMTGALNYLGLLFPDSIAKRLVQQARAAPCLERVAKDLLRACRLPLLPTEEPHVAEDLKRIRKGKPISPIIVVQGDLTKGRPFVIADGYHRICAACHADEDAPVAAVVVHP